MRISILALTLVLAAATQPAFALEPLADFLKAGRKNALPNRAAVVNVQLNDAKSAESFWRLFPALSASAGYTYNSNSARITTLVDGQQRVVEVFPQHQFDATFALHVPLLDLPAIYRYRAAKAGHSQAQVNQQVAAQQVDLQIVRAYFTYYAGLTAGEVAKKHVAANAQLVNLAERRVELGAAQPLEVDRARIELENIRLAQSEAQVSIDAAKRQLKMLTGVEPASTEAALPSDVPEELPLERWESEATNLPTVRAANGAVAIAEENVSAARSAYVPKLNLTAMDRLSNNTGFQGGPNVFTVGITATFNFDLSIPATVRAEEANRAMARLKAEEALVAAREMIAAAHDQVKLQRARCESARFTASVLRRSAEQAYDRYVRGLASQDELLRTQQELIRAEVAETQAYAEFYFSRALLRIVAGKDLTRISLR